VHLKAATIIIRAGTKALIPYFDKVFCTIKHHNDYTKNNHNVDYSWTNDEPDGRDDPHHSEFRLVNILSTGDNYNKFRQPPGALTKIKICAQWGDEIFGTGVKVHRNGAQVKNKVEQIEAPHEETGQGLQLQDLENGTTTLKQAVSFCVANVIYVHSINTHLFILPFTDNEILQILLQLRGKVHLSCRYLPQEHQ
jgi:hypothetical protein